jgi:aryl-alcohol dehydrogenase-like predicted oxidoreductase
VLPGSLPRLLLGTAWWTHAERGLAQALTDEWLALGQSAFDTARAYGEAESVLGACLAGGRDEAVILTKAGHHDRASEEGELVRRVTPAEVAADLEESLAALGTDRVEVLLLHRDDRARPVGPLLEALDAHRRGGHVLSYGASNWATARLDEAAGHAREQGLEPFTSSSVQLSLAAWTEPPWPECETARDEASLAWYERTQLPLAAWSPLAAGFLAGAAQPEVAPVFATRENEERRRRAEELGDRLGATAAQVALAWVLHLPFPTSAVVGPRTLAELRESVQALELELSPEDLRRLEV